MADGKLRDRQIQTAKAGARPKKLSDQHGLHLLIQPGGSKLWRWSYRFHGRQKTISFGTYPPVTLQRAREKHDEARALLADNIDPSAHRQAVKAMERTAEKNSFAVVAKEWYDQHEATWSPSHAERIWRRMERDVFPLIGSRPISQISAPEILEVLRKIEGRSPETAHRARTNIGQVIRYGIATARTVADPTKDLKDALKPVTKRHFPAFTEKADVSEFLRAVDAFKGLAAVGVAMKLAPHLFVRPSELRFMRWSEIDWQAREWRFYMTKVKREHIVPLSHQVIGMLRELEPLTGGGEYVFPGRDPKKPISDMTLNAGLRRLGYDTRKELTTHGWRASARTMLHEILDFEPEIIEHQLGHAVPDANGEAYNRTKFLPQRRKMMQSWSDFLTGLIGDDNVIPFEAKRRRRKA